MTNAKEEFLSEIGTDIKCAHVVYCPDYETSNTFILKVGHNQMDLDLFLQNLNFEYDSGWGSQHVFGTVWFKDNESWAYRDEYDGSEWWACQSLPEIPEMLQAT